MPSDKEVHDYWESNRAGFLQTLATVYFHQKDLNKSSKVLGEALALNPTEGDIYTLQGQIAHARQHDPDAVKDLELASAYGGLTPSTQTLLKQLYAAQHPDNAAGLEAEIDQLYKSLPKPFAPTPHREHPPGTLFWLNFIPAQDVNPAWRRTLLQIDFSHVLRVGKGTSQNPICLVVPDMRCGVWRFSSLSAHRIELEPFSSLLRSSYTSFGLPSLTHHLAQ